MLKWILCLVALMPTWAMAEEFKVGRDYEVLSTSAVTPSQKGPVIAEFFSFGCPWCAKIEPQLDAWLQKQKPAVTLIKNPVAFHKNWEAYSKAWYILKATSMTHKISPVLFDAIHEKSQSLTKPSDMAAFLIKHGVDAKMVESGLKHSPSIDLQLEHAAQLAGRYQIKAIPAFVVNGRYKTDLRMTNGPDKMWPLLSYLLTLKP